jgi:hypothetical protein
VCHAVLGQRVQLLPQTAVQPGHLVVGGGQFGQGGGHVIGVCLELVHPAEPVKGTQHPQVGDVVVTPGEIEQPEPVADGECVKIQRVPLAAVRAISCLVCHLWSVIGANSSIGTTSYSESSTAAERGQHNAMRGQRASSGARAAPRPGIMRSRTR